MKKITYLQIIVGFTAIFTLYISCPSGSAPSRRDIQPPEVTHRIAVTNEGKDLTLTVTATDPSGIASYTTPQLILNEEEPVPFVPVEGEKNIWNYPIQSLDIGKKVSYSNISATDTVGNTSDLDGSLATDILAGLSHTMTVLDPAGNEKPDQAIANKDDIIRLTITSAQFDDAPATYNTTIQIGGKSPVSTVQGTALDTENQFTYTIQARDMGSISYTAGVTPPPASDPIEIVKDYRSGIIVPDKNPSSIIDNSLVTSGDNPAVIDDVLSLTFTANDSDGLSRATAKITLRQLDGEDIVVLNETIDFPSSENSVPVLTHNFDLKYTIVPQSSGDVFYSIKIEDIIGNIFELPATDSLIDVETNVLLAATIVGLRGETEITTLVQGDRIRITTKLAEITGSTVDYNPMLKIGSAIKHLEQVTTTEARQAVFEYVVQAMDSGDVMYSVEPIVDGFPSNETIIDRPSNITVASELKVTIALSKNPSNNGFFAKARDVIQLEINHSEDYIGSLRYRVAMSVGDHAVVPIQDKIAKNIFRYTVLENQNGALNYTVTLIDPTGKESTESSNTTGYIVDTIKPTLTANLTTTTTNQKGYLVMGDVLTLTAQGSNTRDANALTFEAIIRTNAEKDLITTNTTGIFTHTIDENDEGSVFYSIRAVDAAGNSSYKNMETPFAVPLYINNEQDLIDFADRVNAGQALAKNYVVLNKDLDFTGSTFAGIGRNWEYFTGTFDGNKKTIKYIDVWSTNEAPIGFFGAIKDALIKDFYIEDGFVTGRQYVGGVVGYATNSTIMGVRTGKNLKVKAYMNQYDLNTNRNTFVGGILGVSHNNTTIENVYNEATVSGNSFIGGIVGNIRSGTTIRYAYNTGYLFSTSPYEMRMLRCDVGGIAGHVGGTNTLSHVYNSGILAGSEAYKPPGLAGGAKLDHVELGGIVGLLREGSATTISNAFNAGEEWVNGRSRGQIIGRSIIPSENMHLVLTGGKVFIEDVWMYAIGITGDTEDSSKPHEPTNGEYTPDFVKRFTTANDNAGALVNLVFENDSNWVGGSGSYPTLKYFEGWN